MTKKEISEKLYNEYIYEGRT